MLGCQESLQYRSQSALP